MSDYPQTSVSCIVRTQYPYFAQRYAGITGFGPVVIYALKFLLYYSQRLQTKVAARPPRDITTLLMDMEQPKEMTGKSLLIK